MRDAVTIGFVFDEDGKAARMFSKLEDPEPALRDLGEYKRRQIILSMARMPRGQRSEAGQPPAKRSGLFAQTFTYDVTGGTLLAVGTNDIRARILHEGGTITAKNGGALTIPVHRDAVGKRARDFDLDMVPRVGKPWLLVRKVTTAKGVEKKWDVMFILLKSVTIKPHPYLGWSERDGRYLLIALKRQINEEAA